MRKKKDFKEANRSGTSTKALEKTEKALDQYKFFNWMDGFIQPRDGRTNIKSTADTNDRTEKENEEPIMSQNREEDENDYQCDQPPSQREERASDSDKEPPTEDPLPENEAPSKPKKGKKRIQGAAKDTLLEEMEFSLISKMNARMSEREKRQREGKNNKKELDSEDVFCQGLAMDLKQLPMYERCMAKNEMRNVLYKYQIAHMERQMRPYNSYHNVHQNPSTIPPVTPTSSNLIGSPMQQSSSSSFSSPPQTPMPQSQNSWMWESINEQ